MRRLLAIKLAASTLLLSIVNSSSPDGFSTEPLAIYLTKPVGSNVASNVSMLFFWSSLTYSLSSDLAPTLNPPIVAAGRDSGLSKSVPPRYSLVLFSLSGFGRTGSAPIVPATSIV